MNVISLEEFAHLRNNWEKIMEECKLVSANIVNATIFPEIRF